jgi:hypothetical protein
MGHLPLTESCLIPSNCHTPDSCYYIPLLSYLEHHSTYNSLPHKKINSLQSVKELFSENLGNEFCLSMLLHLSFTILIISLTSANLIVYNSSFDSIVQLFTPVLLFSHSQDCFIGSSLSKHIIQHQCFKIRPRQLPILLFLPSLSPHMHLLNSFV